MSEGKSDEGGLPARDDRKNPPRRKAKERSETPQADDPPSDPIEPEIFRESRESSGYILERSIHSGPIPDPYTLARYKEVMPEAPDRIMAMAESELRHGQEMDKAVIRQSGEYVARGQRYALGITLFMASIAAFLGYNGHDKLAGTIIVVAMVPTVANFLNRGIEDRSSKKAKPTGKPDLPEKAGDQESEQD